MRIAIPVWDNKVSPVLDAAERIRVYDFENGIITPRWEFGIKSLGDSAANVIAENTDVLICGALSDTLNMRLQSFGVKIHSWAMGEIDDILKCYACGSISEKEYSMPGCRRKRHKCCAGRKGHNSE